MVRASTRTRAARSRSGKLADLAVLSKDYLAVPVDEIGGIVSLLTMVGGRIVYADGPFAAEDKPRRDDVSVESMACRFPKTCDRRSTLNFSEVAHSFAGAGNRALYVRGGLLNGKLGK